LDDILNKKDELDDLFKKYNISKEEFEKKILNDTASNKNDTSKDLTNRNNEKEKNEKKETDL